MNSLASNDQLGIQIHPAASLFPEMDAQSFQKLKQDIHENGLTEPVIVFEGQLLDGRHRWRACLELGIDCEQIELDDLENPFAFVASQNLHRRHLSPKVRAEIAAKLVNSSRGRPDKNGSNDPFISNQHAADLMGVSVASVKRAKAARKNSQPDRSQPKSSPLERVQQAFLRLSDHDKHQFVQWIDDEFFDH